MSDVISYEPETETLRIGKREFDVLHLRERSKAMVLHSVEIAMRELNGRTFAGAREIYRDTTIAIVPRLAIKIPTSVIAFPADLRLSARRQKPNGPMIYTVEKGADVFPSWPWWKTTGWALGCSCLAVGALLWLLSHH